MIAAGLRERDETRSAMEPRSSLPPHFIRKSSSQRHLPLKLPGARRSGAQILQAQILSGSCLLCDWLYFPQETGIHVENEASHRDILCDPGMRSDFLDLLPGKFSSGSLVQEKKRIGAGEVYLR